MTTYETIAAPQDWLCTHCGRPRSAHTCLEGFAHQKLDFVAMTRVRNEERWICAVLESIRPLCAKVFLMDDHSTDRTVEYAERFQPMVTVLHSPFTGLNESRDKNWLYDQIILRCEPEWILCIDGDEVLEANGPAIIRELCAANDILLPVPAFGEIRATPQGPVTWNGWRWAFPETIMIDRPSELHWYARSAFSLPIAFMWDSRETVRVDRIYGDFWRPSLFRPFIPDVNKPDDMKVAQEFRFKSTPFGRHVNSDQPNLHCSSVPQRRIHGRGLCPARLKHYGYMYREDRVRKLDYYTSIDWKNDSEGEYRHMVAGDMVELAELPRVQELQRGGILTDADVNRLLDAPADARLLHAGPRVIEPFDESRPWPVSDWAKGQHP